MIRIVATIAVAAVALVSGVVSIDPITTMPEGYRDWPLISVARIASPLNDLRAKLGNPVTMRAYKNRTLPFPDGATIARLAWKQATSAENNQAFARGAEAEMGAVSESFVAGSATNVQFMIKNSKKYASTGGWGFAQFTNGKPDTGAVLKTCFGCHAPAKDHDFVFTHYAP
jgi:uncharacterized oligopeptide transporter (OPT) family protein